MTSLLQPSHLLETRRLSVPDSQQVWLTLHIVYNCLTDLLKYLLSKYFV